jgi:hypothetical protein
VLDKEVQGNVLGGFDGQHPILRNRNGADSQRIIVVALVNIGYAAFDLEGGSIRQSWKRNCGILDPTKKKREK